MKQGKGAYNIAANHTKKSLIELALENYTKNKYFNIQEATDNYLADNLRKSLSSMSDTEINSLYRNAFIQKDYKTGQIIRDWHFMKNAGDNAVAEFGTPKLTYHGTPYGGFSKFNSSKLNATIGGSSALGEKGNFTTPDLGAAINYGELGYTKWYTPITEFPLDDIIDVKSLRDWGKARAFDNGIKSDKSVYPLYLTSERPITFDFEGNPWSMYPNTESLGRKWELQTVHNFPYTPNGEKEKGFTETFFDRHSLGDRIQELRNEGYQVGDKYYDFFYNKDWKPVGKRATGRRDYREGERNNETDKWEYYPEIKAIEKVTSSKYKPTTNGLVQQSFERDGNDLVIMKNVQDANPGAGNENWPIDDIVFRNSSQAKLANPFTVDDEGKLIPIYRRDDFTNPDIRYQNTTGLEEYGAPWNLEDAQLGSEYTKWFFENDVLPRLMLSRPKLRETRFTRNSPYIGDFILERMPSSSARGMTTSAIRHDANGESFVTSMNIEDMSALKDKVGALIHESREDMINFHKGLYDNSADQEAYQYITELDKALRKGDEATVQKLLPLYYEMTDRLKKASSLPYLTNEERVAIESAYKTPTNQLLKDSGNLNEKVSENTRFRSEISRSHGNVTGKELDRVIDEMSDEEILNVLSSGDSYGQDYRKYIEENSKQRSVMIENIKNALKKVGIYTGTGIVANKVYGSNGKVFDPATDGKHLQ